jgi:hypothetical protein
MVVISWVNSSLTEALAASPSPEPRTMSDREKETMQLRVAPSAKVQ